MKRKITAVLLCVALLLTLSINVSAEESKEIIETIVEAQNISIADKITVNVGEGGDVAITEPITPIDGGISFTSTGAQKIYTTLANGYRSDLAAAGYGNGYHAFQYNINWLTFVPGTYTVKAYAIGVNSPINPQLTNTKSFTVRNVEGCAEIITSTYIEGWVWKPDAPNKPVDVHAYIYRSNGQVAHIATTIANHLRTDLVAAGKGNGCHGYRIYIDFDSLPEDNLRIELHYVDNSGYHPSFYSGYYDNRMPITLLE